MNLLAGIVVETHVESLTGKYLYSDFACGWKGKKNSTLNKAVKIPIFGHVPAIGRVALGIIHIIGHLACTCITLKKGHLYHAAKGGCEILRGLIEFTPIIGRIFANTYNGIPCIDYSHVGARSWWIIKIYNPQNPDGLDQWMNRWMGWPASNYVNA